MNNILIADAGSSKTDWSLLTDKDDEVIRIKTLGINPASDSEESIGKIFLDIKELLSDNKVDKIFYYGAGCASDALKNKIKVLLSGFFHSVDITVDSDLMAAAKAVFGDSDGIIGILGTGSNSGIYKKGKLESPIPSLGFILGDEGGGVSLGKRLLNSVFKKQLPVEVIELFQEEYKLSVSELIHKVYGNSRPAPFIASFTPFLKKYIEIPEIKKLVALEMENYFQKNLLTIGGINEYEIGMVGSIAYTFRDMITEYAKNNGLNILTILKNPLPKLESYYLSK